MILRSPFPNWKIAVCLLLSSFLISGCLTTGSRPGAVEKQIEKADKGDPQAQYRLGLRYTNGVGVMQDYQIATQWFEKAAAHGLATAQYMAAINYYTGRGVGQNQEKAVGLFTLAADQGHAGAQYQLADAYANGRGTVTNTAWAARYFEKAASQGHAAAMLSIGVMMGVGTGVTKNIPQAWIWLSLAERRQEAGAARLRQHIEAKLSAVALSDAGVRLDNWSPQADGGISDPATIRYVQYRLNKLGFDVGNEDGVLGSRTRTGIAAYLKARNLAQSVPDITQYLLTSMLTEAPEPAS